MISMMAVKDPLESPEILSVRGKNVGEDWTDDIHRELGALCPQRQTRGRAEYPIRHYHQER